MVEVFLWWIGAAAADEDLLASLRAQVERAYDVRARCWHGHERPTDSFDPRRQQHSSTRILKWLLETRPRYSGKIVGLTDADLFIPILTFVYGEAQLGGRAALVSTARLASDNGFRLDRSLVKDRVVKETVHELGHTFGLLHCERRVCVMSRSVNLVQVDAKDPRLCQDCRRRYLELREQGHHEHE
ncbi:MAG TPA: archaemetzincin family Zn-dependent metalloprotease [Vicinamibacterales bacterium]|nr:archaemetzincin family Zn-dependent metalloprotease [Vicinamibacterales bacterium]